MGGRRLRLPLLLLAAMLALAPARPAPAETIQRGALRVAFSGRIAPKALPRSGAAPIAVDVGGTISTTDGSPPPQLQSIEIAINRAGRFDSSGLPVCRLEQIQPATDAVALRACRSALVGEGSFAASVAIPEQSPFPSNGRILAFNGLERGRHVIFAHIYGTEPIPTSLTLPLQLAPGRGRFGTVLSASLPQVSSNIAFVTGISLHLARRFVHGGERRSYLSAGCPAPPGFPGASFPLLRAGFSFAGAGTLTSTLVRSCTAKG